MYVHIYIAHSYRESESAHKHASASIHNVEPCSQYRELHGLNIESWARTESAFTTHVLPHDCLIKCWVSFNVNILSLCALPSVFAYTDADTYLNTFVGTNYKFHTNIETSI